MFPTHEHNNPKEMLKGNFGFLLKKLGITTLKVFKVLYWNTCIDFLNRLPFQQPHPCNIISEVDCFSVSYYLKRKYKDNSKYNFPLTIKKALNCFSSSHIFDKIKNFTSNGKRSKHFWNSGKFFKLI